MRVISQDGSVDIPYEQVVIMRYEENIYFLNKNLTGVEQLTDDIEIATYSTIEKAKKAMEILQNTYYDSELEKAYLEGKYYISPYFRFPMDEELEV